jgi:hypothetical protein
LRDHGGDLSERRRVERTESEAGDGGRRFVVPERVEKGGEAGEGLRIMVTLPEFRQLRIASAR